MNTQNNIKCERFRILEMLDAINAKADLILVEIRYEFYEEASCQIDDFVMNSCFRQIDAGIITADELCKQDNTLNFRFRLHFRENYHITPAKQKKIGIAEQKRNDVENYLEWKMQDDWEKAQEAFEKEAEKAIYVDMCEKNGPGY
jgi:hypothetical protein